ncbi:DUF4252 domain-containing protein [Algibacter miyuki]|uniref:DUF4252 domain-containing protein n=1 Tax=Algibacter miyuki TaxID=1306933 RepID=A0ABV5H4D6_9FLAO|nr:DUF4252 domain-containing protein [Algibacter miyuki]MDN3665701.1 DUF4252 domain-containing protein [Algibacter miyuki]
MNTSIIKRVVNHLVFSLFAIAVLVSCNNEPTLQTYFVDHQESANFISQDLPISMLNMDEASLSETQAEAFNSVKRLNFIGFKVNDTNEADMKAEMETVKTILNNEKYNELIEFSHLGNKFTVKYIGNDDEADEVVVFANSKEIGFGVVRVLGDGMNPSKMGSLVGAMKYANIDEEQLKGIADFFK